MPAGRSGGRRPPAPSDKFSRAFERESPQGLHVGAAGLGDFRDGLHDERARLLPRPVRRDGLHDVGLGVAGNDPSDYLAERICCCRGAVGGVGAAGVGVVLTIAFSLRILGDLLHPSGMESPQGSLFVIVSCSIFRQIGGSLNDSTVIPRPSDSLMAMTLACARSATIFWRRACRPSSIIRHSAGFWR